jgi:hypothetical protein
MVTEDLRRLANYILGLMLYIGNAMAGGAELLQVRYIPSLQNHV